MIQNSRQLQITKDQIKRFESAIEEAEKDPSTSELALRALKSQLETLREEVIEYKTRQA